VQSFIQFDEYHLGSVTCKSSGSSFENSFDNKHTPKILSRYAPPPFKMAAAQMPKFHAFSVIQDQLRGSGMNLILCVYVCVCVCAHARARARMRASVYSGQVRLHQTRNPISQSGHEIDNFWLVRHLWKLSLQFKLR